MFLGMYSIYLSCQFKFQIVFSVLEKDLILDICSFWEIFYCPFAKPDFPLNFFCSDFTSKELVSTWVDIKFFIMFTQ